MADLCDGGPEPFLTLCASVPAEQIMAVSIARESGTGAPSPRAGVLS